MRSKSLAARLIVAGMATSLVSTAVRAADGPLTGKSIEIVDPLGAGSISAVAIGLLGAGMGAELGAAVEFAPSTGALAFTRLYAGPTDGTVLIAADPLSLEIYEATRQAGQPALQPPPVAVAKLTNGLSLALVVSKESPYRSWADVVAAMKVGPVRMVLPDWHGSIGVVAALIKQTYGVDPTAVIAPTRQDAIETLVSGRADIGLMVTASVLPGSDIPVRPLVTFGAERNPKLPDVPTFAEISGDKHNDFTVSVALFAPPGTSEATVASLSKAATAAAADPAVQRDAAATNYPLAVGGPSLVEETIARDRALVQRIRGQL